MKKAILRIFMVVLCAISISWILPQNTIFVTVKNQLHAVFVSAHASHGSNGKLRITTRIFNRGKEKITRIKYGICLKSKNGHILKDTTLILMSIEDENYTSTNIRYNYIIHEVDGKIVRDTVAVFLQDIEEGAPADFNIPPTGSYISSIVFERSTAVSVNIKMLQVNMGGKSYFAPGL